MWPTLKLSFYLYKTADVLWLSFINDHLYTARLHQTFILSCHTPVDLDDTTVVSLCALPFLFADIHIKTHTISTAIFNADYLPIYCKIHCSLNSFLEQ